MLPNVTVDTQQLEDMQVVGTKDERQSVAVVIVNFNMPERADALAEHLFKSSYPFGLFLVDNGSDLKPPAEWTSVAIDKNVQTTKGWLAGVAASKLTGIDYLGYLFLITSTEFVAESGDVLASLAQVLIDDPNAVGVHPALTKDSTTAWKHMITLDDETHRNTYGDVPRRTWMLDNLCALYRRTWWESVGGFDPQFEYGWGPDLELGLKARRAGRSLWIDERVMVRKTTDIGYNFNGENRMRMKPEARRQRAAANMALVMEKKYGAGWNNIVRNEGVENDWR